MEAAAASKTPRGGPDDRLDERPPRPEALGADRQRGAAALGERAPERARQLGGGGDPPRGVEGEPVAHRLLELVRDARDRSASRASSP